MADSRLPRSHELSDSSSGIGSKRRSGSEAIRMRVNQLMRSNSGAIDAMEEEPTASSSGGHRRNYSSPSSNRNSHDIALNAEALSGSVAMSSSRVPHALKSRKSARTENRNVEATTPIVQASSCHSFIRSHPPLARPTNQDEQTLYSSKKGRPLVNRHMFHHQHDSRTLRHQDESDEEAAYNGPIAAAEFERMRKEIDLLKEALHESKKSYKRQTKKLEEAKSELTAATQKLQEKDLELTCLHGKHEKTEELLSTIEASIQCQICMDLPDRPFALAPCGHILCLSCLQEWFRKAPPTLDDMDIDPEELTDPQYILMRSKSCPSCRAAVKHRPVPVFMVKAVAVALRKIKPIPAAFFSLPTADRDETTGADADPWKGIFLSSDEDVENDEDDDDDSSAAEESESEFEREPRSSTAWYRRRRMAQIETTDESEAGDEDEEDEHNNDLYVDTGSDLDEARADVIYTRPHWGPPSVSVDPAELDLSEELDPLSTLKLLQRGCTWDMLQNYDITYSHSSGIVLSLRSLDHLYASDDDSEGEREDGDIDGMNRIFLGWNISLTAFDVDGEIFINEVLEDIKASPARWQLVPRVGVLGAMDARRLVREDEDADYETTDTEVWIDAANMY